jgi:hypothetical protein
MIGRINAALLAARIEIDAKLKSDTANLCDSTCKKKTIGPVEHPQEAAHYLCAVLG